MYLISVYFDEQANKILQRYVDMIANKTGNDFLLSHHVPPHMTVSAIEAISVDVLREPFIELSKKIHSGKIQIVSVGQLLPYVFYATPVHGQYLNELSSQIYSSIAGISETSVSRFYQPGNWLPHVTLGKTLSKEQMQKAFAVMQDNFVPFEATVTEIGLAKVNPHEDVERFLLQ